MSDQNQNVIPAGPVADAIMAGVMAGDLVMKFPLFEFRIMDGYIVPPPQSLDPDTATIVYGDGGPVPRGVIR